MTDENINPQNIPTQSSDSNLTDQKSPPSSLKKPILIVLAAILVIGIPILFFLFFNQTKQKTPPASVPTPTLLPTQIIPTQDVNVLPSGSYVPDQLIVKYKIGQSPDEINEERRKAIQEVFEKAGVIFQEKGYMSGNSSVGTFYLLKFKKGTDLKKTADLLKTLEEIEYVEGDIEQGTFKNQ